MELENALSSILNKVLRSENVHSQIICKKCHKLVEDIDAVEGQLTSMKMVE